MMTRTMKERSDSDNKDIRREDKTPKDIRLKQKRKERQKIGRSLRNIHSSSDLEYLDDLPIDPDDLDE